MTPNCQLPLRIRFGKPQEYHPGASTNHSTCRRITGSYVTVNIEFEKHNLETIKNNKFINSGKINKIPILFKKIENND